MTEAPGAVGRGGSGRLSIEPCCAKGATLAARLCQPWSSKTHFFLHVAAIPPVLCAGPALNRRDNELSVYRGGSMCWVLGMMPVGEELTMDVNETTTDEEPLSADPTIEIAGSFGRVAMTRVPRDLLDIDG